MKITHKYYLSHIFFILVLISQDTCVSHSFFGVDPLLYYISLAIIFSTIVCYSGALSDPGFLPSNAQVNSPYFCRSCQRRVPVRFYHCEKCHQCTRRQIYHSEWTDNCIGFKNHMSYYLFLVGELVTLLFLLIISFISLFHETSFQQTNWFLNHVLLIVLIPIWLYYLLQVSIILLQNTYIACTNGNVLEVRKYHGLTYLYIQPNSHNPFYSCNLEQNLTEVFFPMSLKDYELNDPANLTYYNEDIKNYKNIDYVQDSE